MQVLKKLPDEISQVHAREVQFPEAIVAIRPELFRQLEEMLASDKCVLEQEFIRQFAQRLEKLVWVAPSATANDAASLCPLFHPRDSETQHLHSQCCVAGFGDG